MIATEPEAKKAPRNTSVSKTTTEPPHFPGENESGPGRTRAGPHEKKLTLGRRVRLDGGESTATLSESQPTVVAFVVTEADTLALRDAGGAGALGEVLTEEVEKHGLRRILELLADLDVGAST